MAVGVVDLDRLEHEDRQTRNRDGWIETWVAKPIKQPSRSFPWAAVTINRE